MRNWEIFPSSGHVPLLLRLRQALGEPRPVEEFPACIFAVNEADDAISVMLLSILFFWDCLVVPASGDPVFYASHDEFCDFFTRSDGTMGRVEKMLEDFNRPRQS